MLKSGNYYCRSFIILQWGPGGNAGSMRTYARLVAQFYWQGMRADVKSYVRQCVTCQHAKISQRHPSGLLKPLPIPHQVWEDVSMDFIIALPMSKGFTIIFVVMDRLSKFGHFIPLKADINSSTVAEAS